MKYYAVTEDPNELLHYGVKGMKWGQHIFGDKPKSAGFHRALGKLRAAANKTKIAVRNSATQAAVNRNNRQQEKYNRAVQKTQRRINEIEGLNSLNRLQDFEKATYRQQKAEQKQARYDAKMQKQQIKADNAMAKLDLKYAKNERKMNKYIQQARQGKLKYGKLSDDQVQQITDRLSMERSARNLGSAEKTWRQQKKEAFRKGKLYGIERGTAAAMEEVARAGTVYGIQNFMNRRKLNAVAKQEGKEERIKNRERNKRTRREVRQDLRQEMYEEAVTSGKGMFERRPRIFTANAAKELQKIRDENYESDRVRKLNARLNDEMDTANNEKYQKMLSDQREKKRIQDVQDRLNNDIDDRWQRYLAETDQSDTQARLTAFSADAIDKADRESAQKQRLTVLNSNDRAQNEAAYQSMLLQKQAEEDHRRQVAKLESENKKLKSDYEDARREYEQNTEHDKKAKEKFDKETADYNHAVAEFKTKMDDYNTKHAIWSNRFRSGTTTAAQEPTKPVFTAKKPSPPKYRNTPEPKKPKYHEIDYSEPRTVSMLPSTYEEYMRLKALYGNGGNGGGKKKGK